MSDSFVVPESDVPCPPVYTLSFSNIDRANSANVVVRLTSSVAMTWRGQVSFEMPRKWAIERIGKRYYLAPDSEGYRFSEVENTPAQPATADLRPAAIESADSVGEGRP